MNLKQSYILLILFSLAFISCASRVENKIDCVYVMVYDFDSNPVMDAAVFIDEKLAGNTDIYGRFMFPSSKNVKGYHTVRIEKKGYERVLTQSILQSGEVLYFKTGSGSWYAQKAEELLDHNELLKAEKMIARALEIEKRKDWIFLSQIIQRREQK